jgi:uncharacterized Zn-binding protein involved in type VI secretion
MDQMRSSCHSSSSSEFPRNRLRGRHDNGLNDCRAKSTPSRESIDMPPAARVLDMHVCPMVTGVVPHVGGPIVIGLPTVMIGFMPAARVGDMAVCVGPPDVIAMGSFTVLIGGQPAARLGDLTAHGGVIVMGMPTVNIG